MGVYPSPKQYGSRGVENIFSGNVIVEEKIDGSQFSFGMIGEDLKCWSRGRELDIESPEKMFSMAVKTAIDLAPMLQNNCIYTGEYLSKPKHNKIIYSRVPDKNIILFDILLPEGEFMSRAYKENEATRLGLEVVPCYYSGLLNEIPDYLDRESVLGGKIEGFVIKNYAVGFVKIVRPDFQEINQKTPTENDPIRQLISIYHSEARWEKSFQHLTEEGALTADNSDIGRLIKDVHSDILQEDIREVSFDLIWPKIRNGITAGLPEWYKAKLASRMLERDGSAEPRR